MRRTNNKRNVQFLPGKIKYNALKKFDHNIIKIPSYIIDEVFRNKLKIEIFHKNKLQASYDYDNLYSFIRVVEKKQYDGKFRNMDIKYNLNHVEI